MGSTTRATIGATETIEGALDLLVGDRLGTGLEGVSGLEEGGGTSGDVWVRVELGEEGLTAGGDVGRDSEVGTWVLRIGRGDRSG